MDFKHRVRKQSRAAELLIVVFTTLGSGALVSVLTVLTMRTFGAIAAMWKLSTTTAVTSVDYATPTPKSRLDPRKAEHKIRANKRVAYKRHDTAKL